MEPWCDVGHHRSHRADVGNGEELHEPLEAAESPRVPTRRTLKADFKCSPPELRTAITRPISAQMPSGENALGPSVRPGLTLFQPVLLHRPLNPLSAHWLIETSCALRSVKWLAGQHNGIPFGQPYVPQKCIVNV